MNYLREKSISIRLFMSDSGNIYSPEFKYQVMARILYQGLWPHQPVYCENAAIWGRTGVCNHLFIPIYVHSIQYILKIIEQLTCFVAAENESTQIW